MKREFSFLREMRASLDIDNHDPKEREKWKLQERSENFGSCGLEQTKRSGLWRTRCGGPC